MFTQIQISLSEPFNKPDKGGKPETKPIPYNAADVSAQAGGSGDFSDSLNENPRGEAEEADLGPVRDSGEKLVSESRYKENFFGKIGNTRIRKSKKIGGIAKIKKELSED